MPRLAAGGSVGGSTKAIKAKKMEPQHGSLPTPKSWGARDGAVAQPAVHLHEAGDHPSPPNAGGRSGKERRLHGHSVEVGNDGRLKDEAGRHG
jgi:hypothetical protein